MERGRSLRRRRLAVAPRPARRRWERGSLALAPVVLVGSALGLWGGTAHAVTAKPAIPITVTPSTGLSNGQTVTITGSGFTPSSIGNVLECNSDATQPTVHLGGVINSDIAVGCIAPSLSKLVSTSASGGVSTTFAVVEGTVGPPCGPAPAAVTCPTTDSANADPTADAAKYPCPPTAAQQAIGDICQITYGDAVGDNGSATILFGAETPPSSTTTTAAPAATTTTHPATTVTTQVPTTAATTATTAAPATSPGTSLAATGAGPDLWIVALVGVIALYLGSVALALVERPRLLRRLLPRARLAGALRADSATSPTSGLTAGSAAGAPPVASNHGPGAPGLWFDGWEPDGSP